MSGFLSRWLGESQAPPPPVNLPLPSGSGPNCNRANPAPQPQPLGNMNTPLISNSLTRAEAWILHHENASLNPLARNPKHCSGGGHAFGIGQLCADARNSMAAILGIANPDTTDPQLQLAMFREYIASRYGDAENAQAFWETHHWY